MSKTIYDIARLAGVSGKTVSRVINEEAGVAESTRARVSRVIEESGYQPHSGARSMRGQRRDCVGILYTVPSQVLPIREHQVQWLIVELFRVFGAQGKFICFDSNPFSRNDNGDYARALWQQRCSGCVVHGPLPINDPTILRIHRSGHPYMALNRQDAIPDLSFAAPDYEEAAYLSARHLIQRGHTRIAMLKAFSGFQAGIERRRGYVRAHEEANLPVDASLIRPVNFSPNSLLNTTYRLLQDDSVTAIIDCSARESATELREGARLAGRRPGENLEVLCWTYGAGRTVIPEACAHVWTPLREAAIEGLELLVKWFDREREEPFQVLYRPMLFEQGQIAEYVPADPLFETS